MANISDLIHVGDTFASPSDLPVEVVPPLLQTPAATDNIPSVDAVDIVTASELLSDSSAASNTDVMLAATATSTDTNLRPFLTTPFKDYSVTEGLLLILVLIFAFKSLFKMWNN